jgi:hypothetical protein
MYRIMRGGLGVMFAWVSLEVHPRIEQQEQRDRLQVLHRGQEQLRRNIKRVWSYLYDGKFIATTQAKREARSLWDVMT